MSDLRRSTRRTVCRRIGSVVVALAGVTTIAGANSAVPTTARVRESATDRGDGPSAATSRSPAETAGRRGPIDTRELEIYRGVVDRIVDDRYVVILLEEDGEVVDEAVEPRENLPPVAESDRLIVILEDGELRCVIPLSNTE